MAIVTPKAFGDPAIQWFPKLRFGMFVHFGVYAPLERGEWAQYRDEIPRAEYEQLMHRFNPSKFKADDWIDVAEAGGCRYITLTVKHHDGFCLFDSALTEYKITNTPFGRDLTGELIEACHRRGMRICLYYSQPDWHHRNFVHLPGAFKDLDDPQPGQEPDWPKYLAYCHGQVEELCTKYGRIDGIWFDGSHKSEKTWQGKKLYRLIKKHQPGAVVNERARYGDFFTPERTIPEDLSGYLFEACQSISKTGWGIFKGSPQFSIPNLTENLVRVAAKGGNFLLNVGPLSDGRIPEYQAERLAAIGRWLETHGEGIYETQAGAVETGSNGVVATRKGKALYLFLCTWPDTDCLTVPGIRQKPKSVEFLGTSGRLTADVVAKEGLVIRGLPMAPPGGLLYALRMRFSEEPKNTAVMPFNEPAQIITLKPKGRTMLGVDRAQKVGMGLKGSRLSIAKRKGTPEQVVANWNALEQRLVWTVDAPSSGTYRVRLRVACPKPFDRSTFVVKGPQDSLEGTVKATQSFSDFRWISVGKMPLPGGISRVALQPTELPYGYVFGHIAGIDLTPVET